MTVRKKQNDVQKTESIFDDILKMILKNWKVVVYIIVAAGVAVSGFSVQCGKDKKFEKEKIEFSQIKE